MPKVFVYFRNFKKLTNFFLSLVVFRKNWRVQSGGFPLIQLFWVNSDSPHQKNCEVSWLFDSSSWELNIPTPGSLWSIAWQQRVLSWPFGFWFFSLIHSERIFCVLLSFTLEEAKISDFLVCSTCLQFSVPFPYVFSSSSFFFWASLTFVLLQQLSVGSGSRAQRCLVLWIWGC